MAFLTGDQANFSWTDPSGNALVEADFDFWAMEEQGPPELYRPFGWTLPTATFGTKVIRVQLRTAVNDSNPTPPIPNGARGTLTLNHKATGTRGYAIPVSLYALATQANSTTGNTVMCNYQAIVNASGSSDTITVTGT